MGSRNKILLSLAKKLILFVYIMAESWLNDYDYLFKILAVGDSGVGKTCLLYRYTDGSFYNRFVSTVGIDFREKRVQCDFGNGSKRLLLQLWDTAGQERFRSLCAAFYRDAMGFLLVFDVTNEASFLDVTEWLETLRNNAYTPEVDIVLVGNKCDLVSQRAVSSEQAHQLAQVHGLCYLEASAASGYNVTECVELLVSLIMRRMETACTQSMAPGRRGRPLRDPGNTDPATPTERRCNAC